MEKQISKEDIIQLLRSEKLFLREKFGVTSIGLFGSYAKNEQKSDSDIDLLVELTEPRFEYLSGLQIHMETILKKKIGLIRKRSGVKNRFLEHIEVDVIYA